MADYHFLTVWRIRAPVEQVWEEISHAERWPSWWRYVETVEELAPGDPTGVGRRQRFVFTSRLPYRLRFEGTVRRVEPPVLLEADSAGDLVGTGRWTLSPDHGATVVRYTWDVRPTKGWMNALTPIARPVFAWNHDALMRDGGESLARRLGTRLESAYASAAVDGDRRETARSVLLALGTALAAVVAIAGRRRSRR